MDQVYNNSKISGCSLHVCEIFVQCQPWLSLHLKDNNDWLNVSTVDAVYQYLEDKFTAENDENYSLKELLLQKYWELAKAEFVSCRQDLISSFVHLLQQFAVKQEIDHYPGFQSSTTSSSGNSSVFSHDQSPSMALSPEHNELTDCCQARENDFNDKTRLLHTRVITLQEDYQNLEKEMAEVSQVREQGIRYFQVLGIKDSVEFEESFVNTVHATRKCYLDLRQKFLQHYQNIATEIIEIIKILSLYIDQWKKNHKYTYIKVGHEFNKDLFLQPCCCKICKLMVVMLQMLNGDEFMKTLMYSDLSRDHGCFEITAFKPDYWKKILKDTLTDLIQRSFIVVKEPTDVQKVTGPSADRASSAKERGAGKGKKESKSQEIKSQDAAVGKKKCGPEFNMEVMILCGEGLEGLKSVTKPVTTTFYYEGYQIAGLEASAELNVPQATVDNKGYASFKKQKIKNFDRPLKIKKCQEQVTSERYRLVFTTEISLNNPELQIELTTMSLPMAIITGSNQANIAHGALLWYCYNNNPYDLKTPPSFTNPKEKVIRMIQGCFMYLRGRCLRDDEIDYLLKRMLRDKHTQNYISFDEFALKSASNNDPTFWKWLQSILNLIEFYLIKPWQDGIIYGFVSKSDVESILLTVPAKTFLLRFSESVIQGDGQNRNLTGAIVAAISFDKFPIQV